MSGSVRYGKDIIKGWFEQQSDIKMIVDFGCGEGTYPQLLGLNYHWIGIDIWEPYIAMFNLNKLYDEIIIGDISKIELPDGDCAIVGDVLEHLPRKTAEKTLEKILNKYKHVILSIPLGIYPSRLSHGNKYNVHRSTWYFDELDKMNWEIKYEIRDIGIFIK